MKSLANTGYHQQQQARAKKRAASLEKQVELWKRRLARVTGQRGAYATPKGYNVALTGAKNELARAKKALAFEQEIASGKLTPYQDGNYVDWK